MKYATVCSGIGAPEAAWKDMWGPPEFVSEIEAFPSAVLKHHYPDVPNYGDMTKYKEWSDTDLIVMAHGQGNAEICRDGAPSLTCNHEAPIVCNARQDPIVTEKAQPLDQKGNSQAVVLNNDRGAYMGQNGTVTSEEKAFTLNTIDKQVVASNSIVRRLTPMECERLQGFPDGYTLIPGKYKFKAEIHQAIVDFLVSHFNMTEQKAISLAGHPDGHSYKALGNSMAVPVVRWIGRRINLYESLKKT